MQISKLNSLIELYFKKCDEVEKKKPFLKWLKPEKPTYTWGEIKESIFKLSHKIKSIIQDGDRCLILSENRPYWLISDIAIMNAGGISVPIFTTYSVNDYEHILKDSKPSLIIVSNFLKNNSTRLFSLSISIIGGRRETRTLKVLLPPDFESDASTSSTIRPIFID